MCSLRAYKMLQSHYGGNTIKTTLRPYQTEILAGLSNENSVALFMGTGSGKTITSLAKFEQNGTSKLLVICPKSVIPQWESVIRKELPKRRVLQFRKSHSAAGKNKILSEQSENYDTVIVNFEIIHSLTYLLQAIDEDWTIIVDESHRIKSPDTTVTKHILKLGRLTEHKIILTATPTQGLYGGYIDYFTQLQFLGYLRGMRKSTFMNNYCQIAEVSYRSSPYPIKVITGYKNLEPIKLILNSISRSYIPKFNDYEPEHIKIEFAKPASYNRVVRQHAYRDIVITNQIQKRIALKTLTGGNVYGHNIASDPVSYDDNTIKADWLKDFLQGSESSVVVFYQYNAELKIILDVVNWLDKSYVLINGGTHDKIAEVSKNVEVYIGQYQAMSESIDGLQHKSSVMVFYSLPESSLLYRQALGRIDRIGQTKVPTYYYLVMKETIDADIYDLIEKKVEFNEADLERTL